MKINDKITDAVKTVKSNEDILKESKLNILELYKIIYFKYSPHQVELTKEHTILIDKQLNDSGKNQMQFADWLLQSQIGLVNEDDIKNKQSQKVYLKRYKRFVDSFVSTLNTMFAQSVLKQNEKHSNKKQETTILDKQTL